MTEALSGSNRVQLPLSSDAPTRVSVSVENAVEYRPNAADGLAAYRFQEQTTYHLLIGGAGGAALRVWLGQEERTSELHRVGGGAYWQLNWGNYVGTSWLRLDLDGQTILDLPVEVCSVKLGYLDHYRALLDELANWLAALAFSVRRPTALPAFAEAPQRGSPYLTYLFLRHLMHPRRLLAYFSLVAAQPHRSLARESVRVDFADARRFDARTLADLVTPAAGLTYARSGLLSPVVTHQLHGHVPTLLLDTRTRTDFDTPENRFVAHLLHTLGRQLNHLQRAFSQDANEHPGRAPQALALAEDCYRWGCQVADMTRAPFLADVGVMTVFPAASQVLQRREGYRELRDAFFRLLLSLRVRWQGLEELLQVPNKNLATLYEYWCLFALADALSEVLGEGPDWSDLMHLEEDVFEVRLSQGRQSQVKVGAGSLYYNLYFRRPQSCSVPSRQSYSVPLKPDFVIESGGHRLLFDAKYRLSSKDVRAAFALDFPDEVAPTPTFKREDLYKMHTYRDAIQGTEAVFVLYPGNVFRAFGTDGLECKNSAALPSAFKGVGAVPVLPSDVAHLFALLRCLLGGHDG